MFQNLNTASEYFAAMNGAHVEDMTKDEVDMMLFTPVSDPVPAVHSLDTDDDITDVRFE